MPNAGDEINCMSCHQIEPHIVDMARGLTSDQDAQLARHILGCPSCAGLFERERVMSAALRRLANDLQGAGHGSTARAGASRDVRSRRDAAPLAWACASLDVVRRGGAGVRLGAHVASDGGAERASHRTPPIAGVAPETEPVQALDAASLSVAMDSPISTPVRSRGAQHADLRLDETADSTEFVAWPGATAGPPFESGELIRIDIPTEVGVVQAEVLVGQDGFARAVRLVQ